MTDTSPKPAINNASKPAIQSGSKPSVKKDKQKVTEEVFTEDMLKSFLSEPMPSEDSADFRRLLFAYRGMPAEPFGRFLDLFLASGFDLHAKDHKEKDFLTYLQRFDSQQEYVEEFRARL